MLKAPSGDSSHGFSYSEIQEAIIDRSFDTERFVTEIQVTQLVAVETQEPNKGRTLLWLLAMAAVRHQSTAFFSVWGKFRKHITYDDLAISVESTSGKSLTIIDLLGSLKEAGGHILYEIITQMPGLPNDRVMTSLRSTASPEFYEEAKESFAKKKESTIY